MNPKPSSLRLAADWLDEWDSGDGSRTEMEAVAKWLRVRAAEADDRALAKHRGVTVTRLRVILKKTSETAGIPSEILRERMIELMEDEK